MRHANQEVADKFRNGLANGSNRNLEDGINTKTHLLDEDVRASHVCCLLLLLWVTRYGLSVGVVLLRHLLVLGHN